MSLSYWLARAMLGRRRSIVSGEVRIPGIEQPITIRRDRYGVPCIEAENDRDAMFGAGYVQGQDRAFQLETQLRVVRGTLSELVGAKGLPVDRMSRRIGFHRTAVAQFPIVDADVQASLTAFAAGVNAGRSVGLPKKPHELAILGGEFTPYEGSDVLGIVKLQSFALPSNWDCELARLRILRDDGIDALRAVDAIPYSHDATATVHTSLLDALGKDLALFEQYVPRGGGSNNWVVGSQRSATGKPLLASDPHLGPTIPPPWYLAHINTPEWAVVGAMLAGAPVFPIGHNGFACWGVTAGLTDNTDLFIESVDSDGVIPGAELIREVIHIKGASDFEEWVFVTPRGPIITPLLEGVPEAISMRAVWLDPLPVRGFFDAPRARSFETFRQPFAAWPFLPLNVVYADETGEYGWQLVGTLPKRKNGHGTIPLPANGPHVGWETQHLPFEEMPFIRNPEAGFYGTANAIPAGADRVFLGVDFIDGYREAIIRDELAKRTDWDLAGLRALQLSVRSLPWEQIRDIVLSLTSLDPDAALGLTVLRDWNGHATADSAGAAVYELFVTELCVRVAKAKTPKSWQTVLGGEGKGPLAHNLFSDRRVGHLVYLLQTQPKDWFAHSWADEMIDVLTTVIRQLRKSVGPGPAFWVWGEMRQLRLEHLLFGKTPFGRLFNAGPVPIGGDSNTVSQAGVRPLAPLDFTHNIANLRTTFDVTDWSNSRFVLAGGQSGNPLSPHYADQFELWQKGEGIPIAWRADDVIRSAVTSLRLLPSDR